MLLNFLILCATQHLQETRDFVTPKLNVPIWVDELREFVLKDLESAACVNEIPLLDIAIEVRV